MNPWLVHIGWIFIAHSPIVALDVITIDIHGSSSAELLFRPASEILLSVENIYFLPDSFVMSVGVHQSILPSQY